MHFDSLKTIFVRINIINELSRLVKKHQQV